MASGRRPYIVNVTMAPSTVPWGDSASARAIISTTYIQAMGTMYIWVRVLRSVSIAVGVKTR